MSLSAAIKRAKKIVSALEEMQNTTNNTIVVTKDANSELNEGLTIVLWTKPE